MPIGDTIVAVGTPMGESAIGLVRLSGCGSLAVLEAAMGHGKVFTPRELVYGVFKDSNHVVLDEVMAVYFKGPASYTGEDMAEIYCHGNPLILRAIVADSVKRGCRYAEPGEFTRTAYLNGKIDLSQAEAVCDMISARSERALQSARVQLGGGLTKKVEFVAGKIIQAVAELEAFVDFPEEDLPPEDSGRIFQYLETAQHELKRLLETGQYRGILTSGVKVVILGEPNVGKSSLLNALLGEERAIVSSEAGTTRDYIKEEMMIGKYRIQIIDTAGFRESTSEIEKMGMEKAVEKSHEADIILVVVDASHPSPSLPDSVMVDLKKEKTIIIENKVDLTGGGSIEGLCNQLSGKRMRVSAMTGEGLVELRTLMESLLDERMNELAGDGIVVNGRHMLCLEKAKTTVDEAFRQLKVSGPVELAISELRSTLDALGEVIGGVDDNERVLDAIFNTFCIGK